MAREISESRSSGSSSGANWYFRRSARPWRKVSHKEKNSPMMEPHEHCGCLLATRGLVRDLGESFSKIFEWITDWRIHRPGLSSARDVSDVRHLGMVSWEKGSLQFEMQPILDQEGPATPKVPVKLGRRGEELEQMQELTGGRDCQWSRWRSLNEDRHSCGSRTSSFHPSSPSGRSAAVVGHSGSLAAMEKILDLKNFYKITVMSSSAYFHLI